MENTEAQGEINLATDLAASRQECDMLYRELSKVRDELITSKTERRVLSRWYEDAKGERDKLQVAVAELEAALKASSNLVHAAENERDKIHGELVEVRSALATVSEERDSLRTTIAAWETADTAPFVKVPDVADHVMPPTFAHGQAEYVRANCEPRPVLKIAPSQKVMPECHGCGKKVKDLGSWCGHEGCDYINGYDDDQQQQAWDAMHPVRPKE